MAGGGQTQTVSAAGFDSVTPEVYRELPFFDVVRIHNCFLQFATLHRMPVSSPFWKVLEFIGLPKTSVPTELAHLSWICKSAVLHKGYPHARMTNLSVRMRPTCVHSYGFRKRTSTSDLTGLVRELRRTVKTWAPRLIVNVQEMRMLFDSMPHRFIGKSL